MINNRVVDYLGSLQPCFIFSIIKPMAQKTFTITKTGEFTRDDNIDCK